MDGLHAGHRLLLDEGWGSVTKHNLDLAAVLEPSSDEVIGERITDGALNGPAHRAGPIQRLISFFDQPLFDFVIQLDLDTSFHKTRVQLTDQDVKNGVEMFILNLMEDHDFVQPVQELRAEGAA